jgi:hypothetical protein
MIPAEHVKSNSAARRGQSIRYYCLSPASKTPLEPQSLGEERGQFFIPASCGNEKESSAPGGDLLFIYTDSVDMNILLFFLVPCSAAQGLLQAGRETFFVFIPGKQYSNTPIY